MCSPWQREVQRVAVVHNSPEGSVCRPQPPAVTQPREF